MRLAMPIAMIMAAVTLVACGTPAADPEPVAPETADEVIGKAEGAPPTDAHVWAAWTDSDERLADLWAEFRLEGPPPSLNGHGILLAATGESGSCPLAITNVNTSPDRIKLTLVDVVPPHTSCTDDFNPVTFASRLDPAQVQPPFVVEFHTTSPSSVTAVDVRTANATFEAPYGHTPPADTGRG